MKSILFVCTGNTCRSPMAAALFRRLLLKEKILDVEVYSAGVGALRGMPLSKGASASLAAAGISAPPHRSKPVGKEDVQRADLILVMERGQLDFLGNQFPEAKSKTHLLKRYAEEAVPEDTEEVADPIGQDQAAYDQCREELENILVKLLSKIREGSRP